MLSPENRSPSHDDRVDRAQAPRVLGQLVGEVRGLGLVGHRDVRAAEPERHEPVERRRAAAPGATGRGTYTQSSPSERERRVVDRRREAVRRPASRSPRRRGRSRRSERAWRSSRGMHRRWPDARRRSPRTGGRRRRRRARSRSTACRRGSARPERRTGPGSRSGSAAARRCIRVLYGTVRSRCPASRAPVGRGVVVQQRRVDPERHALSQPVVDHAGDQRRGRASTRGLLLDHRGDHHDLVGRDAERLAPVPRQVPAVSSENWSSSRWIDRRRRRALLREPIGLGQEEPLGVASPRGGRARASTSRSSARVEERLGGDRRASPATASAIWVRRYPGGISTLEPWGSLRRRGEHLDGLVERHAGRERVRRPRGSRRPCPCPASGGSRRTRRSGSAPLGPGRRPPRSAGRPSLDREGHVAVAASGGALAAVVVAARPSRRPATSTTNATNRTSSDVRRGRSSGCVMAVRTSRRGRSASGRGYRPRIAGRVALSAASSVRIEPGLEDHGRRRARSTTRRRRGP